VKCTFSLTDLGRFRVRHACFFRILCKVCLYWKTISATALWRALAEDRGRRTTCVSIFSTVVAHKLEFAKTCQLVCGLIHLPLLSPHGTFAGRKPLIFDETAISVIAQLTVTNPYASSETTRLQATTRHPRWLLRAIVLNGILLTILLVGIAVVYVAVRLSIVWEYETQAGDPVVYQHFFWIKVDPWFATAYFMLPNGILAALFARWKFRSSKETPNEPVAG
jgi:hypothetical protein